MKTMKKTVSLLLSLLMLISVFAAVSFTADAATIDEINITEVFAPAELNSPDTTARVDSNNCKVDSIYWYNVTDSKWMESGESFTEGKVYEVNVHVKANDGSAFTTPDSVITATINGNAATVSHVTMEDPEEYLNFAYRFTATKANKKISSVVISGITEPVAGKYPVLTYDTGSSLYTVKAMEWRLPNDYILGGNTAFEPNSEYQARLYIYPGEGYQFGNNLTATINGHDAVVGQISGSSPIEFLCVKYNYTTGDLVTTAPPETTKPQEITTAPATTAEPQETTAPIDEHSITNIGVVSVVEPEIGEKANSKAYARYGLPFNIQSVSWYNKTDGYMMMIDDDVFEADKTYTARVRVSAKSGYSFNNPTATINEKTANIIEEDGYEKEISLLVTRDFSTPAAKTDPEMITDVNITGVVEPVEAQAPSFAASGEDKYFVEAVTWFNCTDSVAIEAPETFEKGKEYAVNIFLRPHAGYRFNYNPKKIDELIINATVNGKTASSYMVTTGSGGKYIEINCSFIATEAAVVETTAPAETTEPQEITTAPAETTVPQEVTTSPAETTVPQEATTAPVETTEPQETTSPVDPAHTHKWGGWTVTKQANFNEDGEETRVCLDDPSHKETRAIAKLGDIKGAYKYNYTGKKIKPSFTVKDTEGKVLTEGVDYTVSYPNSVKVGLYVAEIAFSGKYEDLGYFEYSVAPLKNTVKATVKTKTVKLSKLKKKNQKVKAITVKNAKGKVTYKITSATKKIKKLVKISSKGVITFSKWKKAKKGTYKVKVKITAAGNSAYLSKSLTKLVTIKVK